ncbi:hypothetical protein HPT29_027560 (plasmid) [Microvirga terrae]|uniref:Uncharacterized protein n=1 Tax=Microvirga terrae TaxID=2740529 RepID=A0ABY5S3J2_9HYPH|nr:DUF6635 family protein [Microvirga terrae]UVF22779.1 hypothetical protein HPT29_027560 [Microvirga terrae]
MQSEGNGRLTAEAAGCIVADAGRRYFDSRRSRVDAFVDRHFSLAGSAAIHRRAVGWDMLKAPANVTLAVPQLAAKLAAAGAQAVGAKRAARYLGSRNLLFDTAVGQEIEWLIMTELLELPFRQGERESRKDALAETILSAPELQESLNETLQAIGRRGDDPEFRQRLEEGMATYAGTRAAAAEITTALMTVGAGAVTVKQATPGVMTLGPALAAALAQQAAIASFPLGTGLGGMWYGIFPAAVSPALLSGVTGGLLAVSSIAAAFAGIVADPIQRRLGLHHRRLLRLIDALDRQWQAEHTEAGFTARDPYVARLLDLVDLLGSAYRLAKP